MTVHGHPHLDVFLTVGKDRAGKDRAEIICWGPVGLLKNQNLAQTTAQVAELGGTERAARVLHRLVMKDGLEELPEAPPRDTAKKFWTEVRHQFEVPNLTLVERRMSAYDGFTKYLFTSGGDLFEAVRIPLLHRVGKEKYVVCISSQVGCNAGCAFCATGKMGFRRNLEVWEMIDQLVQVSRDSAYPIRGVVFMGMGEPMLNYSRVMTAAQLMSDSNGLAIDSKAITVSTVGVVPGIKRFTKAGFSIKLILSLHSAIPDRRKRLVPMAELYDLDSLYQAMREYHEATGRRVPLAWTLLKGINTGTDELHALAQWRRDLPIVLDLIPVNDDSGEFEAPEKAEVDRFLDGYTKIVRQPFIMRYSGGKDIAGACGMLATHNCGGTRRNPELSL